MSCSFLSQVDRHFAGAIDPGSEHRLREHLSDCTTCRLRYERRLLIPDLNVKARGAEQRLGQAMGLGSRARWGQASVFGAMLVGAVAAVMLFVSSTAHKPADAGFVARGGTATRSRSMVPELHVF